MKKQKIISVHFYITEKQKRIISFSAYKRHLSESAVVREMLDKAINNN